MTQKAEQPAGGWIPSSRYDAFISYSRTDAQFAQDLRDRLEAAGKDVWMDVDDIPKGVDWREQIARGMALADNFIFILSPDSVASKVCHEEIDLAVGRNKRILPVVARKVRYRDAHPEMSKINFFVPDERGFDGTAADVLRAIETDVDHAQAHTMLLAKAMDWDANDRNRGFLIKGEQLRKAEDWLAAAPKYAEPTPTALHAEYIQESRRAVTRFTRLVFASVAAFLLVSLVLSLISLAERNERLKTAQSGYLALTSDELVPRDPTLALDLAVRALDLNPANQRAATLLQRLFHESVTRPLYATVDRESGEADAAIAMFGGDPFARDAGSLPTPRAGQVAARYTWDGRYAYGWSSSIGEFEFEERAVEVQSLAGAPILTTSGSLIEKLPTNPEPVVVPSPDGQWLYIAAGSRGELFRSDGERVAGVDIDELPESANVEIVEDRGGELVVRGQGWQCITAPSSSAGGVIPSTGRISAAAFSTDGRRLAVAYFDFFRRVRMAFFDIDASGQPNLDVEATACFQWSGDGAPIESVGRGPVQAMRFSPDGRRLAVSGESGGGGVFERGDRYGISNRQYRVVATLSSELDRFTALAWEPQGSVLTASANGSLKRWQLDRVTYGNDLVPAAEACEMPAVPSVTADEVDSENWGLFDAEGNRIDKVYGKPVFSPCGRYLLTYQYPGVSMLRAGDGTHLVPITGPADSGWQGAVVGGSATAYFSESEDYLLSKDGDLQWPLSVTAIREFVESPAWPASHRFTDNELARLGI